MSLIVSQLPSSAGASGARRPLGQVVRAYVALTKPRIIELLLVTTVPAMVLAQRGLPSLWLILATLVGGTFAAGSANTINCYVDRDIDAMLKQGYRGSRYSFGYPACPKLEDQVQLFTLLGAERIGVSLSDEFQIHPEQSTSAIVVHHPQAKYFSV